MPNFNADDPNNPLLALLAGRNPYGSSGRYMPFDAADTMNLTGSLHDASSYRDPRYWEQYTEWDGDNGQRTGWRPNAAAQALLGERGAQVGHANVGGPGGVIDPSQTRYDEQLGLLTSRDNINELPTNAITRYMPYILALGGGAAIGASSGAFGAGAESSGLGLTADGSAGVGMGAGSGGTGLAGAAGSGLTATGGGSGAFDMTGAGSTGITGNSTIDGLLGRAMSNPLQTAGLLQSIYGMFGGGSGSGNSSGGGDKGGSGAGVANVGPAQRAPYQPNPITAMQLQNMRYARPRGI